MGDKDLRALLDALPDALVVLNDQGMIEWANANMTALSGYAIAQLVGHALDRLIPDEYLASFHQFAQPFFNLPAPGAHHDRQTFSMLTQDQKTLTVKIQLSALQWQSKPCALLSIRQDNAPPLYEKTFEEVKSLFDESQAIAKIGAWEWHIKTGALHWSDQIYRIFGVDKLHFGASYEAFLAFVHPEDRTEVESSVAKALTEDAPYFVQHRIVRQDHSICYVVERAKVYRDASGAPQRMVGTVQDITDEYHYQIQLKLADSVFKHAYDGAISTDDNLNILKVNPAFERISGYSNSALQGIHLSNVVPDVMDSNILAEVTAKGHWRGPMNCVRRNRQVFPAHLSIAKVEDELQRDTKHFVITLTDISSIKRYQQQLEKLSIYDPLTSLFNRSYFIDKTNEAIHSCQREAGAFAVFFVDIDSFKELNDTQGHAEGDRVLLLISQRLADIFDDDALIARFSGDDFVILYRSGDIQRIERKANDILQALSLTREYGSYRYKITASIGIARYPNDGNSAQDLIKTADIAMYKAKASGKNRFLFYEEDFSREKAHRRKLISDLERAVSNHQLQVFYQPKVPCHYSQHAQFEALLRWQHPEMGWVPPLEFIPIAEETGLIVNIGQCVLQQVQAFIERWQRERAQPVTVSINLSPVQLFDPGLLDRILQTVGPDFAQFHCLEFEITESAVIQDISSATAVLKGLRQLGCTISIDDFGTGYSSLSYLSRLPIDTVKIDKSFVRNLPQNQEDSSICHAIVSLAHSLKLQVVAEGIETQEQYWHLQAMGCDAIQGYLFGHPMAADDVLRHIQSASYIERVHALTRP